MAIFGKKDEKPTPTRTAWPLLPSGSPKSGKKDEEPAPTPVPPGSKKGVPTPSRREAERARMERLNPTLDPKAAKARSRSVAAQERLKTMAAIDAAPGKVLMRKVVDTRFNIGEFSMPIVLGILALSMFSTSFSPVVQLVIMVAAYAVMLIIAFDMFLLWRAYKKLARQRIPNEPLKGLMFYGINRAFTFRRMRVPPPVLKRGDEF